MMFLSPLWSAGKAIAKATGIVGGGDYKSYDDLPWAEKAALSLGSGVESAIGAPLNFLGLGDYAPTSFTDERDQLKMEIAQHGHTSGWDWDTFDKGEVTAKIWDRITGSDDSGDDNSIPESMKSSGITGGSGDDLPNRLGLNRNMSGNSLGDSQAVEEDPALQEMNYNRNNFSF